MKSSPANNFIPTQSEIVKVRLSTVAPSLFAHLSEGNKKEIMDVDAQCDQNISSSVVDSCKEFYIKRVRCLEQMRSDLKDKATSNEAGSTYKDGLFRLKSSMIDLMESDILLTGQLISLSEALDEVKRQRSIKLSESDSSSLASIHDDVEEYFDDEVEDDIVAPVVVPRRSYFARQSSILRIPIPPNRRRSRSFLGDCAEYTCTLDTIVSSVNIVEQSKSFKRQSLPIMGSDCCASMLHSPSSDSGCLTGGQYSSSSMTPIEDNYSTKLSPRHHCQNSFDSGIHLLSPTENKEMFSV